MKTKIYLTILISLISVQSVLAQQIIYGDYNEAATHQNHTKPSDEKLVMYKVDKTTQSSFTSENKTLIVCRFVEDGSESNVVCSAEKPEKGWGTMVSTEGNTAYTYEEKLYGQGANIFSIVYTDPNHGWAVGEMESKSIMCAVIFNTTDGGNNWRLQFKSGTELKLTSVGFSDKLNGWATGERVVESNVFKIRMTTTNGGNTWIEQNLAQLNKFKE